MELRFRCRLSGLLKVETSKPCLFIEGIYFDSLFCSCYDAGSVCDTVHSVTRRTSLNPSSIRVSEQCSDRHRQKS